MHRLTSRLLLPLLAVAFIGSCAQPVMQAEEPAIELAVDATQIQSRILHAHLVIPVEAGPLTLYYPKWYPGEHAPTGQIISLAGLSFKASGTTLAWHRDLADGYTFHLQIPAGATRLEADFDSVVAMPGQSAQATSSAHLLLLRWNQVMLYPTGKPVHQIAVHAQLSLPAGWKSASALTSTASSEGHTSFAPVSLERLVDSPLLAGEHFRAIALDEGTTPHHEIDLAADSEEALKISPSLIDKYKQLIVQAKSLFGAEHFSSYHFLVVASNFAGRGGVEHHESSDDRVTEHFFQDPQVMLTSYSFLPHEFAHSWNGKYRRPADLATSDYQQPMLNDLLWSYEGLTDYLGELLGARAGLCTRLQCLESWAVNAAEMQAQTGRSWRPTQDTADSVPLLMLALQSNASTWPSYQRGMDYYGDGGLIWLEADALIRSRTANQHTLDDFIKLFHGGATGQAEVKTYTEQEIFDTLNKVCPYEWEKFFHERLQKTSVDAPIGGLEVAGWHLVYNATHNIYLDAQHARHHDAQGEYSLGISVASDGTIGDITRGMPASQAGLVPGMKILAINAHKWKPELLGNAIEEAAHNHAPIHIEADYAGQLRKLEIHYDGGARYPHLERIPGKPDLLSSMLGLPPQ